MFARLQRLERPFHMQMVGQRDIDRVDLRIGKQRLVAAVHGKLRGEGLKWRGFVRVRCGEGNQFGPFRRVDGRCHLFLCELGSPEDAPA